MGGTVGLKVSESCKCPLPTVFGEQFNPSCDQTGQQNALTPLTLWRFRDGDPLQVKGHDLSRSPKHASDS